MGREMHERLRTGTADAHRAIEEIAVATGFLEDAAAYRSYLRALHGFYAGIEDALAAVRELPRWLPDLAERRKVGWLETDLAALGVAADAPAIALSFPDATTALGAAYVVEGATLGGRWILAHLGPSIPDDARSFFRGYGARTGERWRSYRRAVEEHANANGADRLTSSAVDTFGQMEQWIAANTRPR